MFTSIVGQQLLAAIVVTMGLKDKVRAKYYIEQISQCMEEAEVERWVSHISRFNLTYLT